jgi:hypothetical protein
VYVSRSLRPRGRGTIVTQPVDMGDLVDEERARKAAAASRDGRHPDPSWWRRPPSKGWHPGHRRDLTREEYREALGAAAARWTERDPAWAATLRARAEALPVEKGPDHEAKSP